MNAMSISFQKARALAANLRTSRREGTGWYPQVDRDLAREAHELYYLAQTTSPRVI
ncbi:hypothetical protein [uncultured Phycicoccus sp.]|uniref:hypothetical protein n=1 Tax=uncultured Phycicoccus sp. TaxID=661422 RepID=UPI00260BEFBD|nr:hypothetical protein [uncultured Phycicoccus sp.]